MILLTRPTAGTATELLKRRVGRVVTRARRAVLPVFGPPGPQAVAASLRRGLRTEGLNFELNPRRLAAGERVVGVLSDLEALAEAIEWRRGGAGRRLVAGPNLVVMPSDAPELMTAPEIDVCVVPSDWVRRRYEEDSPELQGRIAVWPAGVDASYWAPRAPSDAGRRALVYVKAVEGQRNPDDEEVDAAVDALGRHGFAADLVRYGKVHPRAYRAALRAAGVMVVFTPTESQGLAQVEAWATDVPTLVWSCGRLEYRGKVYRGSSSPYLSEATGREFTDAEALDRLLAGWDELRTTLRPREWVLENMTDAACARAYWSLAHEAL